MLHYTFLQAHDVNLSHIESRPSKTHEGCYEVLVEFAEAEDHRKIEGVIEHFQQKAEKKVLVQDWNTKNKQNKGTL